MLGTTTYVLFHSAVIAKFPQKLYCGIQDGSLEISCVSILGESKTNSQICMAVLLEEQLYTFKKCLKIVRVQIAAKKLFGNFVS